MPHTRTDGIPVYYEVHGDAADPLLVLISGHGASLLAWPDELVALLTGAGFRVVRFDNRDTGLSHRFGGPDDVDGGYGLEDMAGDVLRILDDLGVAAAHLAGHSMGGMIAQMVAIRHPGRALSLGLLSTIPGQDPRYILHGEVVIEAPERLPRDRVVADVVRYARDDSHGYDPRTAWHEQKAIEAYDRGYSPDGGMRQWSALTRAPERLELLRGVTAPALVFHGRDDGALHWCAAVDMAQALPGSELQIHPGMGHLIPWELWPELVAGIVRAANRAGVDRTSVSRR
jgi:pimeloyl-ACP methyl ester carboxylesterase